MLLRAREYLRSLKYGRQRQPIEQTSQDDDGGTADRPFVEKQDVPGPELGTFKGQTRQLRKTLSTTRILRTWHSAPILQSMTDQPRQSIEHHLTISIDRTQLVSFEDLKGFLCKDAWSDRAPVTTWAEFQSRMIGDEVPAPLAWRANIVFRQAGTITDANLRVKQHVPAAVTQQASSSPCQDALNQIGQAQLPQTGNKTASALRRLRTMQAPRTPPVSAVTEVEGRSPLAVTPPADIVGVAAVQRDEPSTVDSPMSKAQRERSVNSSTKLRAENPLVRRSSFVDRSTNPFSGSQRTRRMSIVDEAEE